MHTCDIKPPPVRIQLVHNGKRYYLQRQLNGTRRQDCGYVQKVKGGWMYGDGYNPVKPSFRTAALALLREPTYYTSTQLHGRAEVVRVEVSGVWFTILYFNNGYTWIYKDNFDIDGPTSKLMCIAARTADRAIIESVATG